MSLEKFFTFNKMMTPILVIAIWIISVGAALISSLIILLVAIFEVNPYYLLMEFVVILSLLITRLYLEFIVVLFKIHENLEDLNNDRE